jgi:hypothetical protein
VSSFSNLGNTETIVPASLGAGTAGSTRLDRRDAEIHQLHEDGADTAGSTRLDR